MRMLARLWMAQARFRQRRVWRTAPPRQELIRRYAHGRSFADIGAMWSVDGEIAFAAEAAGASPVTAVDVMAPTPAYEREHQRRASQVRFVQADIHEAAAVDEIGRHQVVWCSGLLYHAPNPLLTLTRLRAITTELLILATETIPELPGLAQTCVFLPGLSERDRGVHAAARPGGGALGIDVPFDRGQSYGAWWWGISGSALRGLLSASGFEIREQHGGPLHITVMAAPTPS
jgi:hypothetical protein